jgi:acetyl-CoA carboxylase biotin carboxyl carrier protein
MIDIRKLKELVRLMVENDLTELNLQDKEETVTVKRGFGAAPVVHHAPLVMAPQVAAPAGSSSGEQTNVGTSGAAAESDIGLVAITSPMVGTFYAAPNPDSPDFAKVGSSVSKDTTVCMIEAMKVFNEIKAETAGTIERILVQNGQAVEYGQKLFLVRPA